MLTSDATNSVTASAIPNEDIEDLKRARGQQLPAKSSQMWVGIVAVLLIFGISSLFLLDAQRLPDGSYDVAFNPIVFRNLSSSFAEGKPLFNMKGLRITR